MANFSKSPIVKNLSLLVTGTVVAQLLVIGFQLILRRLYSPEEFGAFAVYMSVLGIVATLSSWRYEQAILLPKDEKKAGAVFLLSVFLMLLSFLVISLLIILFHKPIAAFIQLSDTYSWWLWLLPLSILFFGLTQSLNYLLIRHKMFAFSAGNKVWRRLTEGASQSLLGGLGKTVGLVLGDLIGQFLIALRTWYKLPRFKSQWDGFKPLREVALQYKDFPLKNGIPSVLNALSLMLPVIIINRKFTPEETGYFDLARIVLIIPLSLVTASLSQVLLQRFTEKRNANSSMWKEAVGTLLPLLLIGVLFGVVIHFFGAELFRFVFGDTWQISGQFASILVWAFALKFVVSPFNILFTVFEKIGCLSLWQVFYFLLILLLAWLPFESTEAFLIFYLWIEVISYLVVALMDGAVLRSYEKKIDGN
ncbi:MAG: lipopolysaccharide biosynthesis protein [Salinivirgaceae bacterium]